MISRLYKATIGALLVTYGLLYLMSTLLATGNQVLIEEPNSYFPVNFVRVEQPLKYDVVDRMLVKPEKPEVPPPPLADTSQLNRLSETGHGIDASFVLTQEQAITRGSIVENDGDYLPFIKVQPNYPRRALAEGIEGYVVVEFSVTRSGTVVKSQVVESVPPGVFDDEALSATLKFRYKPKVVNGKPIDVTGVRNKISFKINKNSNKSR